MLYGHKTCSGLTEGTSVSDFVFDQGKREKGREEGGGGGKGEGEEKGNVALT